MRFWALKRRGVGAHSFAAKRDAVEPWYRTPPLPRSVHRQVLSGLPAIANHSTLPEWFYRSFARFGWRCNQPVELPSAILLFDTYPEEPMPFAAATYFTAPLPESPVPLIITVRHIEPIQRNPHLTSLHCNVAAYNDTNNNTGLARSTQYMTRVRSCQW